MFIFHITFANVDLNKELYAAGSGKPPPSAYQRELCSWSSRLLRYAKSRPNGKLIYNSIMNGPYVRRMIPEPGDTDREVPVPATFHEQTDDELTIAEKLNSGSRWIKLISDHSFGLPDEVLYALLIVWKLVFSQENLNGVRPVTIVHQRRIASTDYTQLYDFLKYNQKEVDDQRAERLAKTHDPLALMANSNNPFNYPVFHQDQPSPKYLLNNTTHNNNYIPQPSFNQNFMQQPIPNPDDITDPTTAMNMALALMAKAFKLNYSTPTNNNQRISSNPRNRQICSWGMNMGQDRQLRLVGAKCVQIRGVQNIDKVLQLQRIGSSCKEMVSSDHGDGIDLDELRKVNANCILMAKFA
ncbi:hypothetical protein Tco_0373987 [Tanacetum coccineum]